MDGTFFGKLNTLQKIINGNALELDVKIQRIGSNYGSTYGEDYVNFYNHGGIERTVFATLSGIQYGASRFYNQNKLLRKILWR